MFAEAARRQGVEVGPIGFVDAQGEAEPGEELPDSLDVRGSIEAKVRRRPTGCVEAVPFLAEM